MEESNSLNHPHHRDIAPYTIVDDPQYGFKRLDPIPGKEELEAIYNDDYYQTHYPDWIQKMQSEKAYWLSVYDDRYAIFEKHLPSTQRRLLDIGSFIGFFLECGKNRGWDVLGIEPSEPARRIARENGHETLDGFFEEYTPEKIGYFDVINLSLTLEHIEKPVEVLKNIYSFLKPNGIVCIEVPNDFNPLQAAAQKCLGLHSYWIAPPHHINYFNFDSLTALLEHTGFEVVSKLASFPMELFLLMGENYIGNDPVGRSCHARRMTLEKNLQAAGLNDFKIKLYEFFAQQKVGRETILFGQKK